MAIATLKQKHLMLAASLFNSTNRKTLGTAVYTYAHLLSLVTSTRMETAAGGRINTIGTVLSGRKITSTELANQQGIAPCTAQFDLRTLKAANLITPIGKRETGYAYEVLVESEREAYVKAYYPEFMDWVDATTEEEPPTLKNLNESEAADLRNKLGVGNHTVRMRHHSGSVLVMSNVGRCTVPDEFIVKDGQ